MTGWLGRRLFPLLATAGLIAAGMAGTIWGPRWYGKSACETPTPQDGPPGTTRPDS
ncbi:MAG TPA: hypothetical protein VKV35_05155 [Streptosporangiaceae bacterium]|nr:hypothetical protein [Streptosporangiaceae bacterium]